MQVTVYSTPGCPYCRQVKEYLHTRNIEFRDVDVSRDAAAAQEMVRRSGQRGVPVIGIDGQIVIGVDRSRLDSLLKKDARHSLGALVADAADMARAGKSQETSGAYVGRVKAGSAAERAGLRAGDVIVALAGQPVRSAAGLEALLARVPQGKRITIQYARHGQAHTGTVKV